MVEHAKPANFLKDTRVYLSGPMDFVASRLDEKRHGWRNRMGEFLRSFGAVVFDPWYKPELRGLYEYGREGEATTEARERWTFERSEAGARQRSWCVDKYWQTVHIDLRMVDTSDVVIAYCPTNIYSVGTPHEIIMCRQQHKPVLFVSPRVEFKSLAKLRQHLSEDVRGLEMLDELVDEVPIKANPSGTPSLWYMPLVGGDTFFDGFGFDSYRDRFKWPPIPLDERDHELKSPLLPFLEALDTRLPERWDSRASKLEPNDDWILWDLARTPDEGARLEGVQSARTL